jgi:hypothetical protein
MMPDNLPGTRFRPDCTSRVKAAEGPWVTNRYNECGYRTPQSCGSKAADGVRIAVLGSSISQGYLVPYEQSFAARDATLLTQNCRKPVEFQNLASIGFIWNRLADRVDDAIALHPDAAVISICNRPRCRRANSRPIGRARTRECSSDWTDWSPTVEP